MPVGHLHTELSSLFVFGQLEQNIPMTTKNNPRKQRLLAWCSCTQRALGMHSRRKRKWRTRADFSKHRASNVPLPPCRDLGSAQAHLSLLPSGIASLIGYWRHDSLDSSICFFHSCIEARLESNIQPRASFPFSCSASCTSSCMMLVLLN